MDKLTKVTPYNSTSLLLTFASSEERVFDIHKLWQIRHAHFSDAIKRRFQIMYENGDFLHYEIDNGDLVFVGWVEIFAQDMKAVTIPIERYRMEEKEKKLFVHYGAAHFDKDRFLPAKNEEGWVKPTGGLWGSPVDSKYGWKEWCEENHYKSDATEECFYFRLDCPNNWAVIHTREEWEQYPKQPRPYGCDHDILDYDKIMQQGMGDGIPLYAIVAEFADREAFADCFWGYDCDSVIVLNDSILIENYDAKVTPHPLTRNDLLPVRPFKTIRKKIEVSCFLRSPDGKCYIYYEEPDAHYGFKTLAACISDGRIVETGGYSEQEAKDLIAEMMADEEEIAKTIRENMVV